MFDFPTLGPAKYLYKMAATAGPSCREVGIRFSKQELSCFIGVHHNTAGWEKWIVRTPTFSMVLQKIK